jgi:methionine-gamma-lyase
MKKTSHYKHMSTLVSHYAEFQDPNKAHVTPIYQTSTFFLDDAAFGANIAAQKQPEQYYTRLGNPNFSLVAKKIAALEAWDLVNNQAQKPVEQIAKGMVFASGMAALTGGILASVKAGEIIITQKALYDGTYLFFKNVAPQYGLQVVWVDGDAIASWEAVLEEYPQAKLVYVETPVNPAMRLVDIEAIVEIAHAKGVKVMVDNTFATPFCQRPLSLGADMVIHSTTKYLSGHGQVIGGALVGVDMDFMQGALQQIFKILGAVPSPFDTWLINNGIKTFPLRMARHCENALKLAEFLEKHPKVARVYYPGLKSHPDHELAQKQMYDYGGMLSFELLGGVRAGESMMNKVKVATLAVSLGNVDTLIQHPASMTHRNTPRDLRLAAGISDGLVRLSVGIEDINDLMEDLDQAMQ